MQTAQIDIANVHLLGNALLPQLDEVRDRAPVAWNEPSQTWLVTGHEQVLEAYRGMVPLSTERFKMFNLLLPDPVDREQLIGHVLRYFGAMLINKDRPEHSRLRRLMSAAFTRKVVESYRDAARDVINEVLDSIEGQDEIEFVEGVSRKITGLNILRIMGFEDEDYYLPKLARWAYFAVAGGSGVPTREILAQMDEVSKEMGEAFLPLIAQRRAQPADDFVSRLVNAGEGDDTLSDDEVIGNLILTLLAGHDTTLNTMSLSVEALARNPEGREWMRAHPDDLLQAVMELSRHVAMSTEQSRIVIEDFEWCGQQLKAGQMVHIMTAAANRDPAVFANPEKLDFTRDQSENVTFGPGIHHCIGHLFAKMQLEEFFKEFLKRYDSFEVLEPLQFAPGLTFRGITSLKVRLRKAKAPQPAEASAA